MRERERLLEAVDKMHLQWFAEPGGDSGGDGGQVASGKPETGDAGAGKPSQSAGQDGTGVEGATPESSTTGNDPLPPWSEQLEKAYRNDPEVQSKIREIKNTNDLFKRYLESVEPKVETVDQEPKDAPTESKTSQRKPEEYKLQRPEKLPGDNEYKDLHEVWFRSAAAEAGLSQEQAEKVFGKYNQMLTEVVEGELQANKASFDDGMARIQEEYGADYKEALGNAAVLAKSIGGEEFMDFLNEANYEGRRAADHPDFVLGMMRLADRIKKRIGEDVFEGDTSRGKPTKKKGYLRFENTPGMDK